MDLMEIKADPRRGHIALVRGSETVVTFTDLGPVLQVWQTGSGVELGADAARQLGDALHAWAARRKSGAGANGRGYHCDRCGCHVFVEPAKHECPARFTATLAEPDA